MQEKRKTKEQLIAELEALSQRLEQVEELQARGQKVEEALKDEHNFSSALLNTVGALVVVFDREGRIIRFNRACEETTGYSFAEVKNKFFGDIFLTPKEAGEVKAVFHRLLSGDLRNTHKNYLVTKEGNLRLIAWSNTGLVKDGQVEFVIGTGIDITEREKIEKYIAHLASFPQLNPNPILELDLSGRITFYNAAVLKTLERLGMPGIVEAILPEDMEAILQEAKKTGKSYFQREVPVGDSVFAESISFLAELNVARIYVSDITERKRAEEVLRQSQDDLNRAQSVAQTGSWRLDVRHNKLLWSDETYRMFGIPQKESLTYETFLGAVHPEDREYVDQKWTKALQGEPYDIEHRIIMGDAIKWVREKAELEFGPQGALLGGFGTVQDITDRKQAQEATEEVKRQQEAILNTISDLAWLKDREGRYITANEPFCQITGSKPEDIIGRTDFDLWPQYLAKKFRADDQEVMRTGKKKRVEEPQMDKDGDLYWVETIKSPIFNEHHEVVGTTGIARDISERHRMEATLRQVSRALKAVTECRQAILRTTNEAELLSEICRIIVEVGGYRMAWVGFAQPDVEKSVQLMALQGFEDGYVQTLRVSWADVERGRGPTGTAIRTGKPVICSDTQTDLRFAPWREEACKRGYASVLGLPLGDTQPFGALTIYATKTNAFDDEEINLLIGLANDLAYGFKALRARAERRRVEGALRESEQKYRSLMDGASDAIVLVDPEGRITKVNQRVEELLGYSEEELLGLSYPQIHPPQILDHVRENFENILATGTGPLHECVVMRKDGKLVPVDVSHIMVEYGGQRVIQGVLRDVTERKRAGEALRDSEHKLRLLASQLLTVQEKERRRVSRELHDELGQALTVLKIHLVAIENKLRRDQPGLKVSCESLLGYIDTIIDNVRRLSWDLSPSILEDLGLSASLRYLVEEICRNNQILNEMVMDEIDNLFSPEVKINIYRIFQESLTNIVRHAQASRIDVEIRKQADRVTFLLKDNGRGFDLKEASSRKLYQRGLGLTTMQERALMAEGTLSISSQAGQGTRIRFSVPISPV